MIWPVLCRLCMLHTSLALISRLSASKTTSGPEPCAYLGMNWDHETRHGGFGDTFLSLAVIHGVTAYAKVRATPGCLVPKLCYRGRSIMWPLLRDAFCNQSFNAEMVECLLSLGADPNHYTPSESTPWMRLLKRIDNTNSYRLNSLVTYLRTVRRW